MRFWLGLILISWSSWLANSATADEQETATPPLKAPPGFAVSLYADDNLAHDIYSMTLDAQGRVVVAGANYVKTLHDLDDDGRADKATLLSIKPASGAHGMVFLGNDLYCTGDESVMRLRDVDGDGQVDGEPEILAKLKHPEHGANGLTIGPDGRLYIICGNDAGVSTTDARSPGSPVVDPNCGAVVRLTLDGKQSHVIAHGFRNPYDLAFDADGRLWTVDADGERDHHLPWYAPNRLFDIATGQHHGWILRGWTRSWNRPASYFDNVPREIEVGRGSPTGMAVYRHDAFPPKYHNVPFSVCWTFGRVYAFPMVDVEDGRAKHRIMETFLETTGTVGFAPVDIAVGKEGEMYVAIGGRRTRGGVFIVRYVGDGEEKSRWTNNRKALEQPRPEIDTVLNYPQPLDAWARAKWMPAAKELGAEAFVIAACDTLRETPQRVRAIEILRELFPENLSEVRDRLMAGRSPPPEVLARLAWSMDRGPQLERQIEEDIAAVSALTRHSEPRVQRAAWETLASLPKYRSSSSPEANWSQILDSSDRQVRAAALLASARWEPDEATYFPNDPNAKPKWLRTWSHSMRQYAQRNMVPDDSRLQLKAFLEILQDAPGDDREMDLLRLAVLSLGDITFEPVKDELVGPLPTGYTLKKSYSREDLEKLVPGAVVAKLCTAFPTKREEVDRELARLLCLLRVAGATSDFDHKLASQITPESLPDADIHWLMCMSWLTGPINKDATRNVAAAIANLEPKMRAAKAYSSRNWPECVGRTVAALIAQNPELAGEIFRQPAWCYPEQAALAIHFEKNDRQDAARALLKAMQANPDEELRWTTDLAQIVAELPASEGLPALRSVFDEPGLRDTIALHLAKARLPEDRARLVEALSSIQPDVVEASAKALLSMQIEPTKDDLETLVDAFRQSATAANLVQSRTTLSKLIAKWTKLSPDSLDEKDGAKLLDAWRLTLAKPYPELAKRLVDGLQTSPEAWQKRLAAIDWSSGQVERGRVSYEKRQCIRCHAGSSPLGPDLKGVAQRLSRNDLLAAIIDPNKEVAPLYQTTTVETASGTSVHGIIVYESPDATMVKVSPDNTVRISGEEIVAMRKSRQSLMPAGLLNEISDQEMADLFAFLAANQGR
jgi:putative membrane-bound dehydrogenase-like protein